MRKSFVYTDSFFVGNSSVISAVYFNDNTRHMVVELHSGVAAGYQNVDKGVFDNFAAEDRLGGSVGSFWNKMIKGNLEGWDTVGIEIYLTEDETKSPWWSQYKIANPIEHLVVVESDDAGTFHDEAASQDVEIEAAEPEDASEIDGPGYVLYDKEGPEVVDVKAGADIGQRSYEITYEVVVRETRTATVYAANDVEAEDNFRLPDSGEVTITDIRRRF